MGLISKIFTSLQYSVSGDKYRYKDGKYDLDLTYICDNIIAMGFPGENIASAWRNDINDVSSFLIETHGKHFWVFNLTGEPYDYIKFHCQVTEYKNLIDHHPPPLRLLYDIVLDMDRWLRQDEKNVAVVHCLAGRSRTGTVICCYLLYKGMFNDAQSALQYFNSKRSIKGQDVVLPSQIRYVHYYERIIKGEKSNMDFPKVKELKELIISHPLALEGRSSGGQIGYWKPYIKIVCLEDFKIVYFRGEMDKIKKETHGNNPVRLNINARFSGNVMIKVYHVCSNPIQYTKLYFKLHGITINTPKMLHSKLRVPLFRITFHTSFLTSNYVTFDMCELDAPLAGPFTTSEKYVPKNFEVSASFEDVNTLSNQKPVSGVSSSKFQLKRSRSVSDPNVILSKDRLKPVIIKEEDLYKQKQQQQGNDTFIITTNPSQYQTNVYQNTTSYYGGNTFNNNTTQKWGTMNPTLSYNYNVGNRVQYYSDTNFSTSNNFGYPMNNNNNYQTTSSNVYNTYSNPNFNTTPNLTSNYSSYTPQFYSHNMNLQNPPPPPNEYVAKKMYPYNKMN